MLVCCRSALHRGKMGVDRSVEEVALVDDGSHPLVLNLDGILDPANTFISILVPESHGCDVRFKDQIKD